MAKEYPTRVKSCAEGRRQWHGGCYFRCNLAAYNLTTGPYFICSVILQKRQNCISSNSPESPKFIYDIKDRMIDRASLYAQIEKKDLRIDQVDVIAWVTSGCKKVRVLSFISGIRLTFLVESDAY